MTIIGKRQHRLVRILDRYGLGHLQAWTPHDSMWTEQWISLWCCQINFLVHNNWKKDWGRWSIEGCHYAPFPTVLMVLFSQRPNNSKFHWISGLPWCLSMRSLFQEEMYKQGRISVFANCSISSVYMQSYRNIANCLLSHINCFHPTDIRMTE